MANNGYEFALALFAVHRFDHHAFVLGEKGRVLFGAACQTLRWQLAMSRAS